MMLHVNLKLSGKDLFIILFLSNSLVARSQPNIYHVSNAHSHNDYEQRVPFRTAYDAGFGSIEADIFLVDSVLYVAHSRSELQRRIKLETEYLIPLAECLMKNNGHPFEDSVKKLQLLIDIKTYSTRTLNALILLLKRYPSLISCKCLTWVITGNRPDQFKFKSYPDFILFDGVLSKNYSKEALSKIALMSDNFRHYTLWRGHGHLPGQDISILSSAVNKSHRLNKPVRFWHAPDNEMAWRRLELLQVDYINTDHIQSLTAFLNK
jgi:alkaline phosphatase